MKQLTNKSQQGFTLIELVVVIVILGILAATAAPKFINLQDDARTASLNGVKAAMQSAATMVYSKAIIGGVNTAADTTVDTSVGTIEIAYGYPRSNAGTAAGNWDDLLDIDVTANGDYVISDTIVAGSVIIYPRGSAVPDDANDACIVVYTEVQLADAGDPPTVVLNECN